MKVHALHGRARDYIEPASNQSWEDLSSTRRRDLRLEVWTGWTMVFWASRSNSAHQVGALPPKRLRSASRTPATASGRRFIGRGEVSSCSAASASSGLRVAGCSPCHRYQARSLASVFEYGCAPARNFERPLGLIPTCRATARKDVASMRRCAVERTRATNSASSPGLESGDMGTIGVPGWIGRGDGVHSAHYRPLRATTSFTPPYAHQPGDPGPQAPVVAARKRDLSRSARGN
jgi:hypothetical protein